MARAGPLVGGAFAYLPGPRGTQMLLTGHLHHHTPFPYNGKGDSILWNLEAGSHSMIVVGTDVVERYFAARAGHRGIRAARAQYDAWRAIAEKAQWKTPDDVKKSHPKASILKGGRVVFNIKANDYRLIALVQYQNGILMIRFFGSHEEYDKIDAETV